MFYEYDPHRGGFILAKKELLWVPEFKGLYDAFGWDALQYMLFYLTPISPYYPMSPPQRDMQARRSIDIHPWEQGRKLPERLYEDPVFKLAEERWPEFESWIEAKQETLIYKMRVDALNYMGGLDITDAVSRKEIVSLLETIDTLSKQHRENKKALADRLATDDGVAVTLHDI